MKTITIRPFLAAKLSLFVVAALFALTGCDPLGIRGNGNVTSQSRSVSEFSSVEASGALRVEWRSGAPSATITTDSNLMQYIDVSTSGTKLILRTHENLRPTQHVLVQISSSMLTSAALRGAVRLDAQNVSGGEFNLDAAGATRVELTGSASALNATLSGASRLDADSFRSRNVDMSITGAGRADVYASENLSVRISGAGKVTYSGNPKTIDRKVSGAGSIKARS